MLLRLVSRRFVSVTAAGLKPGMIFRGYDSSYLEVITYQHLKTSQGHTSSIVSYLDLSTYKYGKLSVNTEHKFSTVTLTPIQAFVQYLTESYLLVSHSTTFEDIEVPIQLVSGAESVLLPGCKITLHCDGDNVVRVGLSVEMMHELKHRPY